MPPLGNAWLRSGSSQQENKNKKDEPLIRCVISETLKLNLCFFVLKNEFLNEKNEEDYFYINGYSGFVLVQFG